MPLTQTVLVWAAETKKLGVFGYLSCFGYIKNFFTGENKNCLMSSLVARGSHPSERRDIWISPVVFISAFSNLFLVTKYNEFQAVLTGSWRHSLWRIVNNWLGANLIYTSSGKKKVEFKHKFRKEKCTLHLVVIK